jgi:hypothetical protein
MRACAHKDDGVAVQPIDQQKITADVTFPVVVPIALERMVELLRPERCIVGDEQKHHLL